MEEKFKQRQRRMFADVRGEETMRIAAQQILIKHFASDVSQGQ